MSFCTAVNCIDGRVQECVIEYLKQRFDVTYVDMITESGPNLILAEKADPGLVESIFNRLKISIEKHASVGVAVAGHYDCAGNPGNEEEQYVHTCDAVKAVLLRHGNIPVIGLWVDEQWSVTEFVPVA
ncbi:carbonic anhydrase [Spirochaetota bacterium]